MAISMYSASIPVFKRMLDNLDHIIDKSLADAAERKIDQQVYMNARLAPDMFALPRQVQIASDFAKLTASRLAGVEAPRFEDNEATLAELKARIKKTIDYISGFKAEQIDGSEAREVTLKGGGYEMKFKGLDFLLLFALPNFCFHCTTAYNILRHNGVKLSKGDFLQGRDQAK
jgi:uncharacterized protein